MAEAKITKRSEDYSRWYTDVIAAAELADYAPVKGCMIIRPNGYAIWEKMQQALDGMFKETGHQNAYFPLFIPESFLKKEAEHVEGFAPEVAVVTHAGGAEARRAADRPADVGDHHLEFVSELDSVLSRSAAAHQSMVQRRPLGNAHAAVSAHDRVPVAGRPHRARHLRGCRRRDAANARRLPNVRRGVHGAAGDRRPQDGQEKFAGADHTYSIEAMMGDGKALQAGTSHHLAQNFAKAFDVTFQTEKGTREYVYATSWGLSTRMIGALIMTHGDDNGIVIPPKLATTQVVVVRSFASRKNASASCRP